ncbi:aspartate aminotransferase family protein [Geochorda subterranea]|uniref:Aspartate aminotransferase family protein n=1 Tax=Geochorda subterranea TaxID=3109564 RepID=A0ABZ1BRK9_9FIRM|nr:aspartate aminotransferase family protein [Limnochorda sp. LNt]WRP15446.1 aspartate aminotransferase family protein [Limnochorda sp. LNt]
MSELEAQYERRFAGSARLYRRAIRLFPSGLTHDARYFAPFPIYAERASGAYKWDVDGHRLIDYWMGHGALLLGHGHPAVAQAVQTQLARGTHLGASHPLEVTWAELVQRLMPAAQRVRFTNSGTEATHLAMRLARAFTGRPRIVKFEGHFHGWHDYAAASAEPPPGIAREGAEATIVVPPNDPVALARVLESRQDVAAVIIEPGGGIWGEVPTTEAFVHAVRDLTLRHGVLLIFDEVVTGFRMAPGGAQEYYGIRPDLVCLGKILCGGLPGGAVAGRADVLDLLAFRDDPARDAREKVAHLGTFNANPLSAAAGIATLQEVATGRPTAIAAERADTLVRRLNEVLERRRVKGFVYGLSSWFHIHLGAEGRQDPQGRWWPVRPAPPGEDLAPHGLVQSLRRAMLLEGVDLMRNGGFLSTAHADQEIEATAQALDAALDRLEREGRLPRR